MVQSPILPQRHRFRSSHLSLLEGFPENSKRSQESQIFWTDALHPNRRWTLHLGNQVSSAAVGPCASVVELTAFCRRLDMAGMDGQDTVDLPGIVDFW